MAEHRWQIQTWEPPGRPTARLLVLPGRAYTAHHPLLFEASALAVDLGYAVHALHWSPTEEDMADPVPFVEAAADGLRAQAPPAPVTVVLAKSLGTYGVRWANSHEIKGIWLTPLLVEVPEVVDPLTASGPAALAIGGSADPLWSREVAARTRAEVLEIPGADHAMRVPGDWRASMAALSTAMERVEEFLKRAQEAT